MMKSLIAAALVVAGVVSVAAGEVASPNGGSANKTTRPATRISVLQSMKTQRDEAKVDYVNAEAAAKDAKAKLLERIIHSNEYIAAKAETDARLADLELARRSGTTEQRMAAGTAYSKAKQQQDAVYAKLLKDDHTVADAEKIRDTKKIVAESLDKKVAKLDELETQFFKLTSAPLLPQALHVGQVGIVDGYNPRVLQVVDSSNMLIEWGPAGQRSTVWLAGVSTKDKADGSFAFVFYPMRVSGTRQYTTPAGATRTVFVLQEYDAIGVLDRLERGENVPPDELPKE